MVDIRNNQILLKKKLSNRGLNLSYDNHIRVQ